MTRENLIKKLQAYQPMTAEEKDSKEYTMAFMSATNDCFERSQTAGHVVASSWILNATWDKALLIYHIGLDTWICPGGHCDGNPDTTDTAYREAQEETGVNVKLISEEIFDLSAHSIPAKGDEPEHIHYNLSYLFEADENEKLVLEEGKASDIRWVKLEDIEAMIQDDKELKATITRLIDKTLWLKQNTQMVAS